MSVTPAETPILIPIRINQMQYASITPNTRPVVLARTPILSRSVDVDAAHSPLPTTLTTKYGLPTCQIPNQLAGVGAVLWRRCWKLQMCESGSNTSQGILNLEKILPKALSYLLAQHDGEPDQNPIIHHSSCPYILKI